MIIRPKDAVKMLGVLIMCACAVLVCMLFLNSNIDLQRIKDQITDPETLIIFDLVVSSGNMTSAVTGLALGLTTVVMLLFYVKHYIDTHKPELGILKALGYSNWKIAKGFWVFGLSIFVGTAVGFCLAFAFMPAFYKSQRNDGVLPDISVHFNPELVVYLIIFPTIAFALLSVLYSYRKLKRPTLELIRGKGKVKIRKVKNGGKEDLPFLRDLKQSTLRSRFSLIFFVWLSAFCFSATVVMSFSIGELGGSDMMAVMMAAIGVVLAVTTLFLAVTTVIKGNGKTIAMLRVFGYSDHECGRAILNGYRPITYIGFAIGTLYQHGLMIMMMTLFFDDSVMDLPEYTFNVQAAVIALASFVVLYELFMLVYSKRIRRIPLKDVMAEE
ncbi:ABC transporter permease [Anaerocolumna aminovalerica]|uniref:ABC transporter permease n=1 Tax=Anaerocolumna aminovalerica TaxID=1527 RepID=UPI00248D092C|nr:ABC transporter permease [Anaerocolumna aminovalerica]